MRATALQKAILSKRESKHVDFKAAFNPGSQREWVEIVKDIVAMANSGGGFILFGVRNDGSIEENWDPHVLLQLDPAKVTDQLARYTTVHFGDFAIHEGERGGGPIVIMEIGASLPPLIFTQVGSYQRENDPKRQDIAFSRGALYFRHGAKSEPGTAKDLLDIEERLLERHRKRLTQNLRKVVQAPNGAMVQVVRPGKLAPESRVNAKIVTESEAAMGLLPIDEKYPYRQTELLQALNARVDPKVRITSHDLMCVRRVHNVDSNPDFFYRPKFSSPQYSESCLVWLTTKVEVDPKFFKNARDEARRKGLT
jgi:hypothetical protein